MPHPDHLYKYLTVPQLDEWEAYYSINPPDSYKDDLRMAQLMSIITNLTIRVHSKKGTELTQVKDFLIEWDVSKQEQPKKQSVEEMKRFLLQFAKKQNESVAKQEKRNLKK